MEQLYFSPILFGFYKCQRHAVESRGYMRGQPAAQHIVIEIGMQIGEDRAVRLHSLDPAQRIVDGEMAWMRRIAERIDDPDVECA